MSDEFFKPEFFGINDAEETNGYGSDEVVYLISIDTANRLLAERGTVVYGQVDGDRGFFNWDPQPKGCDTHQAIVVAVKSIAKAVPDSWEKIGRDLVLATGPGWTYKSVDAIAERARRLAESTKK